MSDHQPKLDLKYRDKADGKPCVSPFIDGFNVWDFAEKEWNVQIEKAIIRAYVLGWRACNEDHSKIGTVHIPFDGKFQKEEK